MDFTNCKPACNADMLHPLLVERLQFVEQTLNSELLINSAKRSVEYELSKGRSGTSAHVNGYAVDIHCNNSCSRIILLRELIKHFNRIGVYPTFIHVDIADLFNEKNAPFLWLK